MGRKVSWFDFAKAEDQRAEAAVETLERIEQDLSRVSWRIKPHLERIREGLFSPGFSAEHLLKTCPGDRTFITVRFHSEAGASIWDYIEKARLETALRLLRDTDLRVGDIAHLVGYPDRSNFSGAFKRWAGMRPAEFRKKWCQVKARTGRPNVELHSINLLAKVRANKLAPQQAKCLVEFFEAFSPDFNEAHPDQDGGPGKPRQDERIGAPELAEWLWLMLERIPREDQRLVLRRVIQINSPAFFRLLGEKSREESRTDAQCGWELAELAQEHLQANEQVFGPNLRSFMALSWAWIANARRLSDDFLGSEEAFAHARAEWREAAENPAVESEICDLEATLRLFQHRYDEALELLNRAISLARVSGCLRLLCSSLLQRVEALTYTGDREASVADLQQALAVLEELNQPRLELSAQALLAGTLALAGKNEKALAALPRARALCEALNDSVVWHQLEWIEGIARQGLYQTSAAECLYQQARLGFIELCKPGYAAMVSIDLAILYVPQGRSSDALRLASEAIPILEAFELRTDVLAVLDLLRSAIVGNELSLDVLKPVRACLHENVPGASGSWPAGVSENNSG